MKIQTNKICNFLGTLNDADRRFLELTFDTSNSVRRLYHASKFTSEEMSNKLEIKLEELEDFLSGNRNYDMKDLASINALWFEIENNKLIGKEPIKVAGS